MLWQLFITFLKVGLISFGGGYAMLPVIERETLVHHWIQDAQQFTDIIAIAGMSPGPIATNCAVVIGYQQAGILGATIAVIATAIPSFAVILLMLTAFHKLHHHPRVQAAFYGLRPIVTALIVYAAIKFALSNHLLGGFNWHSISLFLIFAGAFWALVKYHAHPLTVLLFAGLLGAAFYS